MSSTLIAEERAQLEAFVDANRAELVETLRGLSEAQARSRLVPSLTTPLGLVKHAAFAEQIWFHVTLAGGTRDELGLPTEIDPTFSFTDADTVEGVIAEYERVCAEARAIAADYDLGHIARHHRRGPLTLRWIYLHMIEEIARHAGHGDILREQILVSTSSTGGES